MQPVSNAGSDIKTMKEEIKEQNQDQESMGGKEERRTNEAPQSFFCCAAQAQAGPKIQDLFGRERPRSDFNID